MLYRKVVLSITIVFFGVLLLGNFDTANAAVEMTIATFRPRTGTADVEGL